MVCSSRWNFCLESSLYLLKICFTDIRLSYQVTDRESLVSELSVIVGQEKVMLDECRELLATAAKLQVLILLPS